MPLLLKTARKAQDFI